MRGTSAGACLFLIALFLFPDTSNALTQGDYTYTVSDGNATITGFNKEYSGALAITNSLGGYPVTSIGNSAFSGCTGLTAVTIPASVTSIDSWPFSNCYSLTDIHVDYANPSFSSIDGVLFDKGQHYLAIFPQGKSGQYTVPSSVTTIGYATFGSCTSLTAVIIPDNVATISSYAFSNCSKLESVSIGSGVTWIGESVFRFCSSLTSFSVNSTNPCYSSLEGALFDKNQTLLIRYPNGRNGDYVVPDSVKNIGDTAFFYCNGLTSVTLQDNVTNIGSQAICCCDSLTNVIIGTGVVTIGHEAFGFCNSHSDIKVDSANTTFMSNEGVLFSKNQSTLILIPRGKKGEYNIPSGVTNISDYAFFQCYQITSVTIPASVTAIGYGSFSSCYKLSSILFLGAPPSLGQSAFGWSSPTIYYLNGTPDWETTFGECPTVKFPYNFTVQNNTVTIDHYNDPVTYGQVLIPISIAGYPVTSISNTAFYGATNLYSITIPDSVTNIGFAAFADCPKLNTVVLGSSLTNIGNWAFYGCTSLTKVYARGDAPIHGSSVFDETTATIYYRPGYTGWGETYADRPAVLLPYDYSVNEYNIAINAYLGTNANVEIPGSIENLSVTSIGTSAFEDCTFLESVTIPDGVQIIGDAAFSNCPLLDDVILPDSLSEIGDWAFAGCEALSALILPPYITSIGNYAFAFCPLLTEVYVKCYSVPTLGNHVFDWTPSSVFYVFDADYTDFSDNWAETFGGRPASRFPYNFSFEHSLWGTDGRPDRLVITSYSGPDTNNVAIPSAIAGNPVTAIEYAAFNNCPNLTTITIPGTVYRLIYNASFVNCPNLTSIFFEGNAPMLWYGEVSFSFPAATIYYLPGTTGWSDTFAGQPTALWQPHTLQNGAFGMNGGNFGFTISWAAGRTVVVEATTNLASGVWTPVITNRLNASGSLDFNDSRSSDFTARFYRIVWP